MAAEVTPNSPDVPEPFPEPARPREAPFRVLEPPEHISFQKWQDSYYDASDPSPMGAFVQRGAGPCHLETGKLIDGDWPVSGPWKQV